MFRTFLLVGASAMALAASSAGAVTFTYTGAAQSYTTGPAGIYTVTATGARGGVSFKPGGGGIVVGVQTTLTVSTPLKIIVGGEGGSGIYQGHIIFGGGGGGGSFVLGANDSPIVIAGGGGGSAAAGGVAGGSAVLGNAGMQAPGGGPHNGAGGSNGAGGQGGTGGGGYNGGGGGGLSGAGTYGPGNGSGGGGSGVPGFAGGGGGLSGSSFGNGGFGGGGGGGGAYGGGGGGGGFSGGGGGGGGSGYAGSVRSFGGGGGGSFTMAGALNIASQASTLADGNGSVSIEALRYFAVASVPDTLDFGIVRGHTTALTTAKLAVSNGIVASAISDKLVTTLGTSSSTLISGTATPGQLAAGQTGTIVYTLKAPPGPGIVSENVTLGFSTHAAGGDEFALPGKTIAVTGTVTDLAAAVIVGKGDGLLTFKNGHYVLDLGDVAANSGVRSTLVSMLNGVTYSAFSEKLHGLYSGLNSDGFSLALRNPVDVSSDGEPVRYLGSTDTVDGGMQSDLGLLGFDPSGLSLGLHSQTIDFYGYSSFGTLTPINGLDWLITVEANVTAAPVAGVPEPATWGLLTSGFGMIGAAMRRRKLLLA